jgi:hypothetical protein
MKIFSKKPFISLALAATAAMIMTSAYAAGWYTCDPTCKGYQQYTYTSSKSYYTTQQTNYCNGLADPAAKSACLAGVPAYADQQSQNVYTMASNACMRDCTSV